MTLEESVRRIALRKAAYGRRLAADTRSPNEVVAEDAWYRLHEVERDLVELIMAVRARPGYEDGPVDLDRVNTDGKAERPLAVAKRWARTACRGYPVDSLGPDGHHPDLDRDPRHDAAVRDAAVAVGTDVGCLDWFGCVTVGEAVAICERLGWVAPLVVEPIAPQVRDHELDF